MGIGWSISSRLSSGSKNCLRVQRLLPPLFQRVLQRLLPPMLPRVHPLLLNRLNSLHFHPLQRFLNPHRQRRMNAATRSTHFPCQMEAREDARLLPTLVRGERPCAPKPTKRNARVYVGSLITN